MPIYVYRCDDCSSQLEKRQGFSDAPLTTCETCGGSIRRVLQPVGIIFKGSGFYSTDNRSGAAAKREGAPEAGTSGTTESKSGDGKSKDAPSTSTTSTETSTAAKSEPVASSTS
jgi:putative FmdB family regulatory protein